jgi:hypothetical protein
MKTWAVSWNPAEHEARLGLLKATPVLFQEKIEGPDVRIHTVGAMTFAERIESCELDYRTTKGNCYQPITPPESILAGCTGLAEECNSPLLGVDFKIERATGVWYFLEANTMPCYEGYDRRAGGSISRAVAGWLAGRKVLEMAG